MSPRLANFIVVTAVGATTLGLSVGVVALAAPVTRAAALVLAVGGIIAVATVPIILRRDRRRLPSAAEKTSGPRVATWVMFLAIGMVPVLEIAGRLTKLAAVTVADALLISVLIIMLMRSRRS